jgi:hypothetical protein
MSALFLDNRDLFEQAKDAMMTAPTVNRVEFAKDGSIASVEPKTLSWDRIGILETLRIKTKVSEISAGPSTAEFDLYAAGLGVSGSSAGITYAVNEADLGNERVMVASLDHIPASTNGLSVFAYRKVAPHWYLYHVG